MVVRIAVQDVEAAKGLVQEFVGLFGGPCVSFETDGEIQVEHASDKAIVQVLDAVGRRLGDSSVSTMRVWVDGHSYMLERAQPRQLRARKAVLANASARRTEEEGW
jgi:hypothetical protein